MSSSSTMEQYLGGELPSLSTMVPRELYAGQSGGYEVVADKSGGIPGSVLFRDRRGWHEHEICGIADARQVHVFRDRRRQDTYVLVLNRNLNVANLYVYKGSALLTAIGASTPARFEELTGNPNPLFTWSPMKITKELVRYAPLGAQQTCQPGTQDTCLV